MGLSRTDRRDRRRSYQKSVWYFDLLTAVFVLVGLALVSLSLLSLFLQLRDFDSQSGGDVVASLIALIVTQVPLFVGLGSFALAATMNFLSHAFALVKVTQHRYDQDLNDSTLEG